MLVLIEVQKSFLRALPSPPPLSTPKKTLTGRKIKGTNGLGFAGICFCGAARNCPASVFTGARASKHRFVRMASICEVRGPRISVTEDNADLRAPEKELHVSQCKEK